MQVSIAWGDVAVIHADALAYHYEVRQIQRLAPDDLSPLQHEAYSWITLITCADYDPATESYGGRLIVRAVLVSIENQGWAQPNAAR